MKIEEEKNRLREVGFIYEIKHMEWVSPLVIVPKKNGKLRVCVNLKKVNALQPLGIIILYLSLTMFSRG